MSDTDITLKQASVNAGVAIELNSVSVSYSWKNLTKTEAVQGTNDISESDQAGFENPVIIVRGVIDMNDSTPNRITQSLMMDLAQADNSEDNTTLVITINGETTTNYLKGRPTSGYSVGASYNNFLYVQIVSFVLNFAIKDGRGGVRWNYTLTMVESK